MKRIFVVIFLFLLSSLSCAVDQKQISSLPSESKTPQTDINFDQILKEANAGDALAQFNLGVMYTIGKGVTQDYKEAVKWYRMAAHQGHVDAQYNLGVMYTIGKGVTQDYKEVVKWYRMAADQGFAPAQFNLGVMYEKGQGVTQDYKEAVKWYRMAADQGFVHAQFNLGVMYENGQGVKQDYIEAYKWILLAEQNGMNVVTDKEILKIRMTDSQIEEAQRLAEKEISKKE